MNKSIKIQLAVGALLIAVLLGLPILFPLDGEPSGNLGAAIGRFHIVLLHFPIALVFLVPLLELLGAIPRWKPLRQSVQPILVLAVLSTSLASILGWLLARGEGAAGSLVSNHMWAGFLTAILLVIACLLKSLQSNGNSKAASGAYYVIILVSLVTLTIGSHHGASLVHGKDYLYARLPENLRQLLGVVEEIPAPITYESIVYTEVIEPIIEQNCIGCHGGEKVKGKFRMDSYDLLLAGGKSSKAGLTPGKADSSEIFRRITLPRNEEKAMPPEGKAPLSESQQALIHWWIEGGASHEQTIDELAAKYFPESIEAILTNLMAGKQQQIPLDSVTLDAIVDRMKKEYGIDLIPYSQDLSDGIYVVARNAVDTIPAQAFKDLYPISQHIHSMNLWRQHFGQGALQELAAFSNLKELHLNESNVSAPDLQSLSPLRRLRILNLHGTHIGDEAVDGLGKLRGLRKLLLTGSKITREGTASLREKLGRCEILAFMPELIAPEESIDPITSETVFEPVPKWGVKDDHDHDHGIGSTHGGVIIDKAGSIYVSSHQGIYVFDESGKMLRSMEGPAYSDIHSMTLNEENGIEYIYGARNKNAEVIKMTTAGEIVLQVPFPPDSGVTGKFMPTAVAVTPEGRILVADGYGSNVIFQFDAEGKYLSSFGGKDMEPPDKFNTPHGLSLDTRYDPVRLLVSDREKRRLAHFDLQGNYIEDVITELRRPCAVSIRGDYVALAELEGRVVILAKDNQIITTLGDNPDPKQWANFKVMPGDWQDGIHTAPHGLSWDAKGNLYVQDWNSSGRITKWMRK